MTIKRNFKHNLKNFTSLASRIRTNTVGSGVKFYKTSAASNTNRVAISPEVAAAVGLTAGMQVDVRRGKVAGKDTIAICKAGETTNYKVRPAGKNLQIDFPRVKDIKSARSAAIHTQRGVLYITVP